MFLRTERSGLAGSSFRRPTPTTGHARRRRKPQQRPGLGRAGASGLFDAQKRRAGRHWFDPRDRSRLKACYLRTKRIYAELWDRHVAPRLGTVALRELTPELIASFRADLTAAGVGDPTVRKTLAFLQACSNEPSSGAGSSRIPRRPSASLRSGRRE